MKININVLFNKFKAFSRLLEGTPWVAGLVLFMLHLGVALSYKWGVGIDIEIDHPKNTWNFFWQTLSLHNLDNNLIDSLWYFHAQPPLFNMYGLALHKLFGAAQLQAMQYLQILLGGILSAMVYYILNTMAKRPLFSLICAAVIALNPSLFLYEAFILYSLPVAFLTTLSVFFLAKHRKSPQLIYLLLFIATVNLLILTRSLFHIILLIPFIALGVVLARQQWRKFLLYACLISLVATGWYLKNYAVFGFFGASSWMGSNLWRNVAQNYTSEEMQGFYEHGLIDEAALRKKYFDPPTRYTEFGFDRASDINVLNQKDYNNINMVAISEMYLHSSKQLILHDPWHYFDNCLEAYGRFCEPSFNTGFVERNGAMIPRHKHWWAYLQGAQLFANEKEGWLSSSYSLLIPLCAIVFIVRMGRASCFSIKALPNFLRKNGASAAIILYIVYVTLVSSLFEYGENCRFKFSIESLLLCCLAAQIATIRMRSVFRNHRPCC